MRNYKEYKLEEAKNTLDKSGYEYRELPNGQLQVNGINFWATSEKFHDPKSNYKGDGLRSFISYLRLQYPVKSDDDLITIRFTQGEIDTLFSIVNGAISHRLKNRTEMNELPALNSAKETLALRTRV